VDTILKNTLGENYFDTRMLAEFVYVLPHVPTLPILVDGHYSKNKPSTLPTFILKTKHQDGFRGFELTNSTSLNEYLFAG
jgi:hypothetical protein